MASVRQEHQRAKEQDDYNPNEEASFKSEDSEQLEKNQIKKISEFGVFMKQISENLALVFNKLIYSVDVFRKQIQSPEEYAKRKAHKQTTIDLVKYEDDEQQMVKELKKKRKKGWQDENKPKRPVSSFFCFYKEKLKSFEPKQGEPGFKLAEAIAKAWKNLSQEEQQPYKDKSKADRARYNEEVRLYLQIHGNDIQNAKIERLKIKHIKKEQGEEDKQDQGEKQIKKKLKGISMKQLKAQKRKDYSHRPKAPQSSFFCFYRAESKKLIEKYNVTQGQKLSRIAAQVWKQMSQEEKLPYELKTREERVKYHEAMRQYRLNYPEQVEKRRESMSLSMKRNHLGIGKKKMEKHTFDSEEEEEVSHEKIDGEKVGTRNQKKKSTDLQKLPPARKKSWNFLLPHKPRGSVSAFFHFYHMNLTKFSRTPQGYKTPGSVIVKKASVYWNDLPDKEKQPYFKLAKQDHQRYQLELQEYQENYPEEYATFMKTITNRTQLRAKKNNVKKQKLDVKKQEISVPVQPEKSESDIDSQEQSQEEEQDFKK